MKDDQGREIIKSASAHTDWLSQIDVPADIRQEIIIDSIGDSVVEGMPIFGKMMSFFQKSNEKLNEYRTAVLLQKLCSRSVSQDEFRDKLEKLFSSSYGISLFSKIIRIMGRDYSPSTEDEFLDLLAEILSKITSSDIDAQFEEQNYILSQIEKLSSQELIILSKYNDWNDFSVQRGTRTSGQLISGDWHIQAAQHFAKKFSIEKSEAQKRIEHVFLELKSLGMVDFNTEKRLSLTAIGQEIFDFAVKKSKNL